MVEEQIRVEGVRVVVVDFAPFFERQLAVIVIVGILGQQHRITRAHRLHDGGGKARLPGARAAGDADQNWAIHLVSESLLSNLSDVKSYRWSKPLKPLDGCEPKPVTGV